MVQGAPVWGVGSLGSAEKPRSVGIFTSPLSTVRLPSTLSPHMFLTNLVQIHIFSWETNSFREFLQPVGRDFFAPPERYIINISSNILICHAIILKLTWNLKKSWFLSGFPGSSLSFRFQKIHVFPVYLLAPGRNAPARARVMSVDRCRPWDARVRDALWEPGGKWSFSNGSDKWMEVIISSRDNLSENFFFVDLCGGMFTFFVRRRSSKGPRRDGLSSRRVTATWWVEVGLEELFFLELFVSWGLLLAEFFHLKFAG